MLINKSTFAKFLFGLLLVAAMATFSAAVPIRGAETDVEEQASRALMGGHGKMMGGHGGRKQHFPMGGGGYGGRKQHRPMGGGGKFGMMLSGQRHMGGRSGHMKSF